VPSGRIHYMAGSLKRLVGLFVSTACVVVTFAAGKHHVWQTGTVLDSQHCPYFAANTPEIQGNGRCASHVIEGADYVYLAREPLRGRYSKPANLAVNVPVKFAADERRVVSRGEDGRKHETQWHKLFVVDNDGEEREMEIVKKVLKAKPAQPSAPKS